MKSWVVIPVKNNDELWESETKGLLLIDGACNTVMIPFGSDEMDEVFKEWLRGAMKYVRMNKTKTDLNNSIREYLNKQYVNVERN